MQQGLICYPGSIMVDGRCVPHVMLAPPMIATEEQLEEGVSKLRFAADQVFGSARRASSTMSGK